MLNAVYGCHPTRFLYWHSKFLSIVNSLPFQPFWPFCTIVRKFILLVSVEMAGTNLCASASINWKNNKSEVQQCAPLVSAEGRQAGWSLSGAFSKARSAFKQVPESAGGWMWTNMHTTQETTTKALQSSKLWNWKYQKLKCISSTSVDEMLFKN